jgi:hypothetical protein
LIASCLQQVLGSFIMFEITWPGVVFSCIEFLKNASDFIQIDLLEIPGLACPWASYSYETKFHVSMATPLVISVMLIIPVPVAWFLKAREDDEKRKVHQNPQSVDEETTSAEEGFGSSVPDAGGFGRGSFGTYGGMSGGQMVMGSAMGAGGAQFGRGGFGDFGGSSFSQPQQDRLYFGSQPASGGFGSQPEGGDYGGGGFSQPQQFGLQDFGGGGFGQPASEDSKAPNWKLRYEKTVNTFMNNIMCVHSCDPP